MKKLENDINKLIIKSFCTTNIGLFYGKIGYAVCFYELSLKMKYKEERIKKYADFMINEILKDIPADFSLGFADGLCGVGWAIEYLISRKFIQGNSFEICKEIDKRIMTINPVRLDFNLNCGLYGLLHYVLLHASNCYNQSKIIPFDNDFLESLDKAVCICNLTEDSDLQNICREYSSFRENNLPIYNYNVSYFVKTGILKKNSISLRDGLCGKIIMKLNNIVHEDNCYDGSI